MKSSASAKLQLIASMLTFGTIGIFVRHIPLPSSILALVRGITGTLFLLVLIRIQKTPLHREILRQKLFLLLLSGACIGFNWILLFESYRYTSVATATLCYYLAPVFVILASPLLLKERLTSRKLLCVLASLVGMVFVSGILDANFSGSSEMTGVLYGIGAAALYATVMLLNRTLTMVPAYDKTIFQLGSAALVTLPYVLITERGTDLVWTPLSVVLLLLVGIVHTGSAYALYFNAMGKLPVQTVAIFSYIDPVAAIILAAIFLGEGLTPAGIIGAVLILGSTLLSELPVKSRT